MNEFCVGCNCKSAWLTVRKPGFTQKADNVESVLDAAPEFTDGSRKKCKLSCKRQKEKSYNGFMSGNDKSRLALDARNNVRVREQLIQQSEQDILKIASKACYKYVDKSDDEWSIALCAFSRAIDTYDETKGDFMSYAAVVIKRDLIDYHRREARHDPEVLTSPEVFEGNAEETEPQTEYAVVRESFRAADRSLSEEITAMAQCLAPFGFSFMDLTECSPKQNRSRESCDEAIQVLADDRELYDRMLRTKQLPSSDIIKRSGVSAKILDKYRKYIIASAIILADDYPCLAWYLKPSERRQQK